MLDGSVLGVVALHDDAEYGHALTCLLESQHGIQTPLPTQPAC